jgi:hypothetical protein
VEWRREESKLGSSGLDDAHIGGVGWRGERKRGKAVGGGSGRCKPPHDRTWDALPPPSSDDGLVVVDARREKHKRVRERVKRQPM